MMDTISYIGQAFRDGGIWMIAILMVQIASVAIIIERFIALYVMRKPNQTQLANDLEPSIKHGDIMDAQKKARSMLGFRNPIAIVAQAGTEAALNMGGRDEIQAKMDEVLYEENNRLNQRTGFLAMLGNVGTLLGLLGTIVGLIQSFASVAGMDPVKKSTMLTQGISMAMNTTAYGLIMAIPALVMFAVLQNRTHKLQEDLNQGALRLFNWLSFHFEAVGNGNHEVSRTTTRRRRRTAK